MQILTTNLPEIGDRFGRLIVTGNVKPSTLKHFTCKCDCGKVTTAYAFDLLTHHKQSCGCHHKERIGNARRTHGQTKTRMHNIWLLMRNRCKNPKYDGYHNYGGRGVTVCERWDSFESFVEDMGEAPSDCTLDRIDVNGNYEPSNCRWADNETQGNNKRTCRYIEYEGQKMTITQLSRVTGINACTLKARIGRGMSQEDVVSKERFGAGRKPKK